MQKAGLAYPSSSTAAQEVHSMHISLLHGNLVHIASLLILHLTQQISMISCSARTWKRHAQLTLRSLVASLQCQ